MSADLTYNKKINFLKNIEANTKSHSGRTLMDHLIGVYNILKNDGAPQYLQDAGLFHSIYGTVIFKHQSTNNRDAIIELIGEQAEEIVWEFCNLPRERYKAISEFEGQLKEDLLLLTKANNIEQR
jgi:hypothetical protein|tara:strand:- start:67 stop:441 length:375 start_codon:yes stop_codon:yes gene_type:complete